ncbi:MAG TPA: sugar phosphate isomerase/epimerase family protein [Pirellulales bacterium]
MKFAICNETFLDWPFEKACRFARECGYTGLEIAPFTFNTDVQQISDAQRSEIAATVREAGLEVVGLHWLLAKTTGYHLTSPDAAVRRATADYVIELTRCCRAMGGSLLVFGSPMQRNVLPGVTHEQATQWAIEAFSHVAPVLAEERVTLCLEPLGPVEGNFLNTAAEADAMIERIGSPWVRLHLDCKAMSSEAQPIPDVIRAHSKHFHHFHANDPNRLGPGMGELKFEPIFAALQDVKYDGWVSVEVFDYSPGIEKLAIDSIRYMQDVLERLKTGA